MKLCKITVSCILIAALILSTAGCAVPTAGGGAGSGKSIELLSSLEKQPVEQKAFDDKLGAAYNAFSLSLLQHSRVGGENSILSPYSVYIALAMAANGAGGETLSQMEALLGMPVSELNAYIPALQEGCGEELRQANSMWFHYTLPVKEEFLQTLNNYFSAQVFSANFKEPDSTLDAINSWIYDATEGRISEALKDVHPLTKLCLVNALSFDAQWASPYEADDISDGSFFGAAGEIPVEMMHSTEYSYLEADNASGFMKSYDGGRYSFVALLPHEGITLDEYLHGLSAEDLMDTILNEQQQAVSVTMPKLSLVCDTELKSALSEMGMIDAFSDSDADFSRIDGIPDLCINRVIHKSFLQVDELGTQAGAASIVEIREKYAMALANKAIVLDRPYLMGIYDNENACFLFLGTVENPA